MNLKNINKIIMMIILVILIIAMNSVFYSSNAAALGFLGFNNAPRKYLTVDKEKLADITIRMEDNNKISYVQLYTVNSKGEKKKIDFSSANTENSKNCIYTLSHDKLLKGKEKQFYVVVKDKTGNTQKSYFQIRVKSKKVKGKTVKYYAVNDSPRVINPTAGGNKMSLGIKDNGGTKYAKIQDANNENKEVYKFTDLAAYEQKVEIDLTKFKKVDDIYRFRVITEDYSGQKAVRTMHFKVDPNAEELKPLTDPNTNNKQNETIKILFVGNSKTYVNNIPKKFKGLAKAGGYNVSITTATKGGRTLKWLAKNKKSIITKKAYDYVIMQEQSDTYAKKYSTFLSGAKAVKRLVKAKNPEVNLIVRQTWVYRSSNSKKRQKAYENAQKVASNIGASLVYDGKAFDKCRSTYSSINLYKDGTHQSVAGAYLSACCIYKKIFSQSPVGLSYRAGLSASSAKRLQQISDKVQ